MGNVDRCKVQALRSMFQMTGTNYDILDCMIGYPNEVRQLIDIFSINRKYVLRSGFLSEDLEQRLRETKAVVSADVTGQVGYDVSDFQPVQLDQDMYKRYVIDSFEELISGFLDLSYNDLDGTKVRSVLTEDDLRGYHLSSYLPDVDQQISEFRKTRGIPASFDEKAVVDGIDDGTDFLEDYTGDMYTLVQMEISRRAATLQFQPRARVNSPMNTDRDSVELKTRYSYYRKAKVLEYYRFMKGFFSQVGKTEVSAYGYDQSYFEIGSSQMRAVLVWDQDGNSFSIDNDLVAAAAKVLADISFYVASLRERLKLQTRKNYMRGTSNLLSYLVNQYIVDYAKTNGPFLEQSLSDVPGNDVVDAMKSHSARSVDVVEYYDQTEYFNISSDTDDSALNGNGTNPRYWEGDSRQTSMQMSDGEISAFYMRDLGVSADCSLSNFRDFIDSVFAVGADSSYIDRESGMFSTKLCVDPDVRSIDQYRRMTRLIDEWNDLTDYFLSDDPFYLSGGVPVSDQMSTLVDMYIRGHLSAENLSAVSSVYDRYAETVVDISSDVQDLYVKYDNFLSDEYQFYYVSSDREYCLTPDGLYRYDYFVGNSMWQADNIYDKLVLLRQYSVKSGDSDGNIVFHGLHDTISALSTQLFNLSNEYKSDDGLIDDTIFSKVSGYGYIDISSATLDESLDDCQDFVQNQINDRIEYLKSLVQTVLQTARDLKSQYIAARTTFTNAINTYDSNTDSEGKKFDGNLTEDVMYTVGLNKSTRAKGWSCLFNGRTAKVTDVNRNTYSKVVFVRETNQYWYYF